MIDISKFSKNSVGKLVVLGIDSWLHQFEFHLSNGDATLDDLDLLGIDLDFVKRFNQVNKDKDDYNYAKQQVDFIIQEDFNRKDYI